MTDPFYPALPEEAQKEAMTLLGNFKDKIQKIAEEVIGDLYIKVMPYIESDTWNNFRNEIMGGFQDYNNKIKNEYDFKTIRESIFKQHKEELIKDLNQDLLKEIEKLKTTIRYMEEAKRY